VSLLQEKQRLENELAINHEIFSTLDQSNHQQIENLVSKEKSPFLLIVIVYLFNRGEGNEWRLESLISI
jgi:hypothetical protein